MCTNALVTEREQNARALVPIGISYSLSLFTHISQCVPYACIRQKSVTIFLFEIFYKVGRGGRGQVFSLLAFYSDEFKSL